MNVVTRESQFIKPRKETIANYDNYITGDMLVAMEQAGWGKNNPFRFNWSSPIVVSSHISGCVYFGGNFLFRTMDRGNSWEIISPDLTTADPVKMDRDTGGLTPDVTGAENHCSIVTISESPIDPKILWAGTDDGNVAFTKDGGTTWFNVRGNVKDVPEGIWVSRVEASHFNEGTCYLTFDGHRSDNFKPWIFKTTDFGHTWTNIAANIPDGQVASVIREDPINRNLLFVGTEFGLFVTINGGRNWQRFMNNFPNVAVHDLLIHPRDKDLIASTHGRGIWICDDITPLENLTDAVISSSAALFSPGVATMWQNISRGGNRGHFFYRGENPQRGAAIHFYFREETKGATLEITEMGKEDGLKMTVKLSSKPGINRYVWRFYFAPPDLNDAEKKLVKQMQSVSDREARREYYEKIQKSIEGRGLKFGGINRQTGRLNPIPADPGVYTITLRAGSEVIVKSLTVRKDPILN